MKLYTNKKTSDSNSRKKNKIIDIYDFLSLILGLHFNNFLVLSKD